ncbi:MAG TPA: PAS domain-containing sensor histidine kinase [Burkholderiaceae bacterium]|nr:PAS domain-containing sensor histidine kinase [Burkholderiaceae bacterium]
MPDAFSPDPVARLPAAPERRWLVLGVGAVLALVGVGLWAPSAGLPGWVLALLGLGLGALAVATFVHLAMQARVHAATLARFTDALRDGDVGAALRVLRTPVSAPPASVWASLLGAAADPPPALDESSRFGQAARSVEAAFGERERRWQARMRLSADWHWETGADLRLSWVSHDIASLAKLGLKAEELLGNRLDEVSAFREPEGGWPALRERMAQRRSLRELPIEVERAGRASHWIVLNGRAYIDEAGRFVGYEGIGRDITEQRLAHQRLAQSERRHAMMAELAADWYWQTDALHRLIDVGAGALALTGQRAEEVFGRTRWELHPNGASEAEWAAHRADLDARRPFRGFEMAVRSAGGRGLRWVAIAGVPRTDAKGEFAGYHGVGRDITLKKRAERLLLTRNEQLERLVTERTAELEQTNRDLEAFARQLAHELRTPIGHVVGLSDLVKTRAWERLGADEREWLRLAGQAARDMSHTVTALLELARSTSTALLLEAVDLSALAESVIADLPWLERKAPVQWTVEPGLTAHCSAALARVVLQNLLGNAAKFTRDVPAPQVSFRRDEDGGEGALVVRDNGAGFDAERAATLFQPFVRLHRSEQFQGTGLGLSIVRRILERHGGGIAAHGEAGQGASFHFRFAPPRAVPVADAGDSTTDAAA